MRLRVRVGVHEEGKENMSSHAHELQQAQAPPPRCQCQNAKLQNSTGPLLHSHSPPSDFRSRSASVQLTRTQTRGSQRQCQTCSQSSLHSETQSVVSSMSRTLGAARL